MSIQFSYQYSFNTFKSTYGSHQNWPLPYQYMSWFQSLQQNLKPFYLDPTNYCYLYQYSRQQQKKKINQEKPKKLSRAQKRKLKKQQLIQEYNKQEKIIGKWVIKQRKDLIQKIKKIQQQQIKQKQKKQHKLDYLIEIHKEVYKHHMKKKNITGNNKKNQYQSSKKKRMTIIKKMKLIFQNFKKNKKQKQNNNQNNQTTILKYQILQKNQQIKDINENQEYEDISDDEDQTAIQEQKQIEKKSIQLSLPNVSFDIKEIIYKNIGKMAGKLYGDIKLRQWVTNIPNSELQELTLKLVNRLAYKQAIKRVHKPQKAKKLIVSGIKQCKRTLTTIIDNKKSKCLIVALNIQRNNLIKGTDDQVQKCINLGQQNKIPIIHISTRSKLGRAFTGKFGPRITIISIINYQGYQDMMQQMIQAWNKSCKQYQDLK